MPWWNSLGLQDSTSPLMSELIFFHDHNMTAITLIIGVVDFIMSSMVVGGYINRSLLKNQLIEMFWTVLPALILLFIALPSLRLLYLLDEASTPSLTVKVFGHQWYWSYEYSEFKTVEFDSNMTPESELSVSGFRVLEVDHQTVMPFLTQIRILTTVSDVIHSWAVPSLGVKADAVTGRLNQLSFLTERMGVLYCQCSEICGANHSFMPIVLEVVMFKAFLFWLNDL